MPKVKTKRWKRKTFLLWKPLNINESRENNRMSSRRHLTKYSQCHFSYRPSPLLDDFETNFWEHICLPYKYLRTNILFNEKYKICQKGQMVVMNLIFPLKVKQIREWYFTLKSTITSRVWSALTPTQAERNSKALLAFCLFVCFNLYHWI